MTLPLGSQLPDLNALVSIPMQIDQVEMSNFSEKSEEFVEQLKDLIFLQDTLLNKPHELQKLRLEKNQLKETIQNHFSSDFSITFCTHFKIQKTFHSKEDFYEQVYKIAQTQYQLQKIQYFLEKNNMNFILEEDHILIASTRYADVAELLSKHDVPCQAKYNELYDTDFVTIALNNFSNLLTFLKKEDYFLNFLQHKFDELFKDQIENSWNIKILSDDIGFYRIDVQTKENITKKYFSIFQLFKKAKLLEPTAIFNDEFLKKIEENLSFKGLKNLEKLFNCFKEILTFEEQMRTLFESLDSTMKVSLGRKTLTDLYQRSNCLQNQYEEKLQISYTLAQQLQHELGDVILANSINISTFSDELMEILESLFAKMGMTAANGAAKKFLADTRASGMCHQANIGFKQFEDLQRLMSQALFIVENQSSISKQELLSNWNNSSVNYYAKAVVSELQKLVLKLGVQSMNLSADIQTKINSITYARTIETIDKIKAEVYQRLIDAYTLPGSEIWKDPAQMDLAVIHRELGVDEFISTDLFGMRKRSEILFKAFESTRFFQKYQQDLSFKNSFEQLQKVMINRIETCQLNDYQKIVYYGPKLTSQALDYFERLTYNLKTLSLPSQILENLYLYFISQAQDWVGCSEGLVGKLQVALEYTITDESIQGEILKTKKDFKNVYWELRTVQGMCPAGYARESSTFQTAVDSELSKRIGLGIGYQEGVQGSIGYQGYINEAEAVIKMNVRSYDHVYDLYFKSFAEKLQHLTQNQESPEHLLKSLGASLERYQNFESGEWRYFYVEQDLPELVLHYLIEKKILEKGSKASNVYDSFLQELKIKNYFVYCKRVTAPPQRNYSNEAAGSTATSQMSGTTYQSKSTGNQW